MRRKDAVRGAFGQKRTAGAVLVQPDSQGSQHATVYLKSFWLIAYTYIPIGPFSRSSSLGGIEDPLSPAGACSLATGEH